MTHLLHDGDGQRQVRLDRMAWTACKVSEHSIQAIESKAVRLNSSAIATYPPPLTDLTGHQRMKTDQIVDDQHVV
jgi:hypothetical protein